MIKTYLALRKLLSDAIARGCGGSCVYTWGELVSVMVQAGIAYSTVHYITMLLISKGVMVKMDKSTYSVDVGKLKEYITNLEKSNRNLARLIEMIKTIPYES